VILILLDNLSFRSTINHELPSHSNFGMTQEQPEFSTARCTSQRALSSRVSFHFDMEIMFLRDD
jgi:hypothetical protein